MVDCFALLVYAPLWCGDGGGDCFCCYCCCCCNLSQQNGKRSECDSNSPRPQTQLWIVTKFFSCRFLLTFSVWFLVWWCWSNERECKNEWVGANNGKKAPLIKDNLRKCFNFRRNNSMLWLVKSKSLPSFYLLDIYATSYMHIYVYSNTYIVHTQFELIQPSIM